jgi:hypothetical protein
MDFFLRDYQVRGSANMIILKEAAADQLYQRPPACGYRGLIISTI